MTPTIAKLILSRLTPAAFASFIEILFDEHGSQTTALNDVGEGAFFQPILDSYGGSLHSVFLRHLTCGALFPQSAKSITRDPALICALRRLRDIYAGQLGAWGRVSPQLITARKLQSIAFLTDINAVSKRDYEETIIPRYTDVARKCGLRSPRVFVGSYESYVDMAFDRTSSALETLLTRHSDGVRIALDRERFVVQRYEIERPLAGAILRPDPVAYEPVYILPPDPDDDLLREFERLLNECVDEARLEIFLSTNFRRIFGQKYDRIETQLWLKFPELDISGRNRRMDLFMRNSITSDWELVELKRSDVRVASLYREVPTLSREVIGAIQQLRNYARLLEQQDIRAHLRNKGIEYFEPDLTLMVGRTANISVDQWRWLTSNRRSDVQVKTYGQLLDELRLREMERRATQYVVPKRSI